jgi:large subunit ribosomal protein L6
MSRVGKKIITLPKGVSVTWQSGEVRVKGPKGELAYRPLPGVDLKLEGDTLQIVSNSTERTAPAIHGLTRALIANNVTGVSEGFKKVLEIVGTGYRAQLAGRSLTLQLGYSHPIEFPLPDGIDAKVESPTRLEISGIDKQLVGQVAANIRRLRPPEPYKGKGVKYENEYIRRKAGKSAGA